MPYRPTLLFVVMMWLLSSCAGMGMRLDVQSAFQKGLALFDQGSYDKAIEHFRKATELDPNFARGYLYLGRSYLNLGRWMDAVPPLRTAHRLSPEDAKKEALQLLIDALLGAAASEAKKGNAQSSFGLLKEVLEHQSSPTGIPRRRLISALISVGAAFIAQNDMLQAIEAYSAVAQLAPKNLDAHLGLARAFLSQGEVRNAISALREALIISPMNIDAMMMLEQLRQH